MKYLTLLLILSITFLFNGCGFKTQTYYKPQADNYLHTQCGGANNHGVIHINDKLSVFIEVYGKDQIISYIKISYALAPDTTLQFDSNVMTLESHNYHKNIALENIQTFMYKKLNDGTFHGYTKNFPYTKILLGEFDLMYKDFFLLSDFQKWRKYSIEINDLQYQGNDTLKLKLPTLLLNGEKLILDDIIIDKVTETYFVYIC